MMLALLTLSAGAVLLVASSSAEDSDAGDCVSQARRWGLVPHSGQNLGNKKLMEMCRKPTGDLGDYVSSYSSAHSGVFSDCQAFTSSMPSSLTSDYAAWVTSVSEWSVSFESTVSAAASTCVGLNANPVIVVPTNCADDTGSGDGGSNAATSPTAAPSASATVSSGGDASGARAMEVTDFQRMVIAVCVGTVAVLAVAL